ncbi:acetyltransferase [Niabella ginsenosidivorans]|uniref:Acetyltransferase n=1 Tax=Niabella ginsenosidivorans TaxID=1176587 RepID=A0A1A9I5K9_9BACT|nr:GNAT family N-acetyltransferase [Niabella ginsenosidivorans]ANH81972.1 acetyltransferase [Niabella ginsenosidivorans]
MIQKGNTFIRKAIPQEASLIHELALDIWPKAFEEILSPEQIRYMFRMMYATDVLKKEMERGVEFYILNHEGAAAGYTAIEQKNETAWKLHKIYLSQKLHGKGFGKYQLHTMEAIARNNGAEYLCLNVNRYNKALDFYRSQGYIITGTEDIDIGGGYFMNDYVMQKRL